MARYVFGNIYHFDLPDPHAFLQPDLGVLCRRLPPAEVSVIWRTSRPASRELNEYGVDGQSKRSAMVSIFRMVQDIFVFGGGFRRQISKQCRFALGVPSR